MRLPKWVGKYVGIEYEPMGRGPRYDCFGLAYTIIDQEYGLAKELQHLVNGLQYDIDDRSSVADLINHHKELVESTWIPVEHPQEGDLVVFNIYGRPNHIGVMANSKEFMHIERTRTAEVASLRDSIWRNRVEGFYRHV